MKTKILLGLIIGLVCLSVPVMAGNYSDAYVTSLQANYTALDALYNNTLNRSNTLERSYDNCTDIRAEYKVKYDICDDTLTKCNSDVNNANEDLKDLRDIRDERDALTNNVSSLQYQLDSQINKTNAATSLVSLRQNDVANAEKETSNAKIMWCIIGIIGGVIGNNMYSDKKKISNQPIDIDRMRRQ